MELLRQPKEYGYLTSEYFDSGYFDVLYYDDEYVEKQETETEVIYKLKNNSNDSRKNCLKVILATSILAFVLDNNIVKICFLEKVDSVLEKILEFYKITCQTFIRNKELNVELEKIELEKLKLNKK